MGSTCAAPTRKMSVPKKKQASRKKGSRRSHHSLKKVKLSNCPKCKKPLRPHFVCANCGFYKGKDILELEKKLTKKELKQKRKEDEKQKKAEKKAGGIQPVETKGDDEVKAVV